MSSSTIDRPGRLVACVAAVQASLDEVADVQPVYLATADKATALVELARAEARLAELRMRVMATAEDVAESNGSRDVATWLAHRTQTESKATRADLELAKSLDKEYGRVAAGLTAGDMNLAQARAITSALDDLRTSDAVGPDILARAEEHLVGYADRFRPRELRRLGRHILDVVAPEIAEEEEARKLAEQEREARKKARLHFRPLGDGTTRVSGRLPDPVAARLKTYLDAYTSPRHQRHRDGSGNPQDPGPFGHAAPASDTDTGAGSGAGSGGDAGMPQESGPSPAPGAKDGERPASGTGPYGSPVPGAGEGDRIPQARKYADAFAALLEHLDPHNLPEHGGDATTVMITVTLDQLRQELAAAGMIDDPAGLAEGGHNLTAAEARRLACTATLIPLVLGTDSEILDQGRARRLFTPAQRRAMRHRDKTCRAEGCEHPATWCEAHHWDAWTAGGQTNIDDGVMICPFHHHRIHDPAYATERLPNGDIRFHRRI